jgi:hypothetical protein
MIPMAEASAIGLAAAFAAGLISVVSPCVLPLVPAYVSYVAGQPLREDAARPRAHEKPGARLVWPAGGGADPASLRSRLARQAICRAAVVDFPAHRGV